MVRHDDVANECEPIAGANFFENLDGQVSGADRAEQRPALITTKCDEMQVTAAGETFQLFGHKSERGAHPLKNAQRVGHPG